MLELCSRLNAVASLFSAQRRCCFADSNAQLHADFRVLE